MSIKFPIPSDHCIVIPAFNAEKALPDVLRKIRDLYSFERNQLIIVNDGSTDNTFKEFDKSFCLLLNHEKNRGKGEAILTAFKRAREMERRYMVFLDADGQHAPESVKDFVRENQKKKRHLIIGKRKMDKEMPWTRKLSNFIGNLTVGLCVKKRVWDTQCGFRLVSVPFMEKFTYSGKRYELETEILIKFIRSGAVVGYIPIPTIYNEHKSHYKMVSGIIRFWKAVFFSFL